MRNALLICFLIFLCVNFPQTSVAAPEKKVQLVNDSATVVVRNLDQKEIKSYSLQKEFIYDNVAPETNSLWQRFWIWIWSTIERILGNKYSGGFIKYVVIALLIVLVVFVVIKLIGIDFKIFARKSKAVHIPYAESTDNIHEINFNEEIEKAIDAKNYRLAVRLFYLHSLKLLNDKDLIDWQPEKTNQTYVTEIADPERKEKFYLLTRQFEYIWYGEFFIDQEHFNTVKMSFERFNVKNL